MIRTNSFPGLSSNYDSKSSKNTRPNNRSSSGENTFSSWEFNPKSVLAKQKKREATVSLPDGFNPSAEIQHIKTKDYPKYLNLPASIKKISFLDISTAFLPFGDNTGVQVLTSYFFTSEIYQRLQNINAAIAFLDSNTNLSPNSNLSYIKGRPPYGKETDPKWKAAQEEVFKQLRRDIANQLTVIADRLNTQLQNLKISTTLAQNAQKAQDGVMSKLVQGFAPRQG